MYLFCPGCCCFGAWIADPGLAKKTNRFDELVVFVEDMFVFLLITQRVVNNA